MDIRTAFPSPWLKGVDLGDKQYKLTNQDAIPDDYKAKRISFTIDKDTIRSRIDNGESIPGAHLSNAEPSLTIRRK